VAFAAPASAEPFGYASDLAGGAVFQYEVGSDALLAPLSPPSLAAGDTASHVVARSGTKTVYVTITGGIAQFGVGAGGLLSPLSPATVPAGPTPAGIAMTPNESLLFVTDADVGTISVFYPQEDGTLEVGRPATYSVGGSPAGLVVSPDNKSLYVMTAPRLPPSAASVLQFDVHQDGTLTPKSPPSVPAGRGPASGIAVSPDGKWVYALNSGVDTISQYGVGAGGRLTALPGGDVGTGDTPAAVAVSPDGQSVYVANFGDGPGTGGGSITQYDLAVTGNGALAPKRPLSVAADASPAGIALSGDGRSAYAPGDGVIYQFGISSGGKLVPRSPATVPAGRANGFALVPDVATSGDDVLYGTAGENRICGLGGNDVIVARDGDDVLFGDRCGERAGRGASDVLRGGPGHDKLVGGAGRDRLTGGGGRDRMHGGPGRDRIVAGAGRDVLDVRGGDRDRVDCGDGRDKIKVDGRDRVRNCERVR
jgi:DNA-binding beta-propeller fold protein YncE